MAKWGLNMTTVTTPARPWLDHYPEGIDWSAPLGDIPIHHQILSTCSKHGSAVALDFLGAETSYESLGRQIKALAGALQKDFGVKPGTRVALLLPNTPFYPVAYYAILLAGGTIVNCNPLYTISELSHITDNAEVDVLITVDIQRVFEKAEALCHKGRIKKLIVCEFARALPPLKRVLFSLFKRKDLADLKKSLVATKITLCHELIAEDIAPTPVEIDPENQVAVQQYTGGTTGVPKGAMLSHANIARQLDQIDVYGLDVFSPPNKIVAVLPFFHVFSMTVCMNVPLRNGATVVMLPKFELGDLLALLSRTRPTVLPAVPTLLYAIASSTKTTPDHLKSLRVAISGGAGLPDETRHVFAQKSDALLAEGYGLTETSPVLCCSALNAPSKPNSIGQPLPGTDVAFVDLDDPTKFVAIGERGELVARGPQVMLGYFNDPEATKNAFVNGWFRTGDVGYMDEEGYAFLVDRIKDLIICSGFNVYPRAIEDAVLTHPDVEECNVIGVPDKYRGEAPIAFVKLKSDRSLTKAELMTFLTEHLSKLEMPRDIIFKTELPKTFIGKLSKKELRTEYAEMKDRTDA